MAVKQRLSRSNIYMFLIPLLIAAALLLVGTGIALYVLETVYLPKIGMSLQEMHITLEQYESMFAKFEVFLWVYLGAVGMALLLTIVFTNVFLTRSLFRHISEPLELLVAGVERVEHGDLDTPIAYTGADDYIEKPFSPSVLVARVKANLSQYRRLKPQPAKSAIVEAGPLRIDTEAHTAAVRGEQLTLTNKEYGLLLFLARHPNQVFSREDLYERIWGLESMGDNITVAVHVNRLREKVEENPSKPQRIQTVWGVGYRLNTL